MEDPGLLSVSTPHQVRLRGGHCRRALCLEQRIGVVEKKSTLGETVNSGSRGDLIFWKKTNLLADSFRLAELTWDEKQTLRISGYLKKLAALTRTTTGSRLCSPYF
jgi:hypothetical protein